MPKYVQRCTKLTDGCPIMTSDALNIKMTMHYTSHTNWCPNVLTDILNLQTVAKVFTSDALNIQMDALNLKTDILNIHTGSLICLMMP